MRQARFYQLPLLWRINRNLIEDADQYRNSENIKYRMKFATAILHLVYESRIKLGKQDLSIVGTKRYFCHTEVISSLFQC